MSEAYKDREDTRTNEYFVPKDGIDREVITADICRYLGNEALVRPGNYENPQTRQIQQGYFITAYRNITAAMIADLKADSERWEAERRATASRGQPSNGISFHDSDGIVRKSNTPIVEYHASTTHQSRQYYGPTEAAPGPTMGYGAAIYPTDPHYDRDPLIWTPHPVSRSSQDIRFGSGTLVPTSALVSRNIGQYLNRENSPQELLSTTSLTDSSSNAPSLASRAEHSKYSSATAASSGTITSLTPTSGYTTHLSDDDDDESYETCSEKSVTLDSAPAIHHQALPNQKGTEFRISEIDEDLLHPAQYQKKLRELQALIYKGSWMAHHFSSVNSGKKSDEGMSTERTQRNRIQQCRDILGRIEVNIALLQNSGFCDRNVTFLQLDPSRPLVASMRSVELDDIARLSQKNSVEEMDSDCAILMDYYTGASDTTEPGNHASLILHIIDVVLISHVSSHVEGFDNFVTKGDSSPRGFQISPDGVDLVPLPTSQNAYPLLCRRTLRCLKDFLRGRQVWVLHGAFHNYDDSDGLYVSTSPELFTEVWGQMWKITPPGDPELTLRYDLEYGSIIPGTFRSGLFSSVNVEADEQLCHWISRQEMRNAGGQGPWVSMAYRPNSKLLIGAYEHSVYPNPSRCFCNMSAAKERFQGHGWIRPLNFVPLGRITDSYQVHASIGGGIIGAPTIGYSQTMKVLCGYASQEAFCKRWLNKDFRNWKTLLAYCALEISICTRNCRRVRFVDLLAGNTIQTHLANLPSYRQEPWRAAFESTLHTNPELLIHFSEDNLEWRKIAEEYISYCLETLLETGIGSRTDQGRIDNRLRAFWIHGNQDMIVAFPPRHYSWTGFMDFDSVCSFIVLEACLVNRFGRQCCHPFEHTKIPQHGVPPVLEIFLFVNENGRFPEGMKKMRSKRKGQKVWIVKDIEENPCSFHLGERGILHSHRCCSHKVLVGQWESMNLMNTAKRKLGNLISSEALARSFHYEQEYEGSEVDVEAVPYLIQERLIISRKDL